MKTSKALIASIVLLLALLATTSFVACSSASKLVPAPTSPDASAVMSLAADYAVWRSDPANASADDSVYLDTVLVPRALSAAGITQAVDNPKEALQAWATDATITSESTLLTLGLVREVHELRRYEFEEVNLIVAKLLEEGFR